MGVDSKKCGDPDSESRDRFPLPLTVSQKIWFLYVVPTSLCCIVYIADIATDIALVERHIADDRCFAGGVTFTLLYAPALVFFLATVANADKWPDADKGARSRASWFLKQVGLLLLFPVNAIHRFAGKLFWSLEALICPEEEQEEALAEASKPSKTELYLLLQAFLQAAPQALFQTYILATFKIPHERTGTIQVLGIVSSIASASIAATCYMRFESQRIAGRHLPWATASKNSIKKVLEPKESLMTTIDSQITVDTMADNTPAENPPADDALAPKTPTLPKGVPQSAILSLPPLPPQIRARLLKASGDELPEDLQKDFDDVLDGEPLNIRISICGSNNKPGAKEKDDGAADPDLMLLPSLSPAASSPEVGYPPPPMPLDIPMEELAQAPDGTKEEEMDGSSTKETQSLEEKNEDFYFGDSQQKSPDGELRREDQQHLSREPLLDESTETLRMKPASPEINYKPIPLPTRKWKIEGLREDDFFGKLIALIWWYLFISSRVLSLAILAFFYPWAFAAVTLLHYLGMVAYLFTNSKTDSKLTTIIRLGLAFVYLLCFVEIRTKFKNPKSFTFAFVLACTVENVASSMWWYFYGDWSSWWFLYAFCLIIATLLLSMLAMGFYFLLLRPEKRDIYTN